MGRNRFSSAMLVIMAGLLLALLGPSVASAAGLRPFTSDGCSLFPDGTLKDRTLWCDCCLSHDMAYWQGGTTAERKKADKALRACVLERTHDKALAATMYLGVRAGGMPAFPAWYRWGYGWTYGRGYKALSADERQQAGERLAEYRKLHPGGYCAEKGGQQAKGTPQRPAAWATPVPAQHLKNFYKLDDKVYRAAQPNKKGFQELRALGITTVLDLRDYHDDDAGREIGLRVFRVKMDAGGVTVGQVVEALTIIENAKGPVLIHCWHGSDRTGLVSALYRIVFQGWSKEDAVDELEHGGYGYHSFFRNIPDFIKHADIEAIRRRVSGKT